jgi:hypothetical protein
MRIDTPSIREDDLPVDLNPGYGKPWGDIILSKDGRTRLQWVHEDDCDRLIKAAAELKNQIIDSRARAAAPHGRRHLHEGRCQLCGKPEDDGLHAEPAQAASDEAVAVSA